MFDIRDNIRKAIKDNLYKQSTIAKKSKLLTKQQLSDVITKRRKLEVNEFFDLCEVLEMTPEEIKNYHINHSHNQQPA